MTSQAFNHTKLYKAISTVQTLGIGISSWLSFSGIKKILPPSEGLTNDITAGLISVGMFCSMYTLLQSQKLMVELGTKSTTALATHLAAIVLMLGLSPPTNFIAQVADPAAIRDMQQAQKVAEEMGMEAITAFHSSASIVHLIDSTAKKMDTLRIAAEKGDLTGQAGCGAVCKKYGNFSSQLYAISEMIDGTSSEVEELSQRSGIALSKMQKATENDLPLSEQTLAFENSYREFANIYARLKTLNLHKQIEASLRRLQDESIAEDKHIRNSAEALKLADRQAQKLVNDIMVYVNDNTTPLKPLPAYKLDSPSVVSFRYWSSYIPQLSLSIALDMSFFATLWMLIALREFDNRDDLEDTSFKMKDLNTLADAMRSMMDARNKGDDE